MFSRGAVLQVRGFQRPGNLRSIGTGTAEETPNDGNDSTDRAGGYGAVGLGAGGPESGRRPMLIWLRANPLAGRLLVKLAVALPLGLGCGVLLAWLCDVLGLSQNLAAVGAAVVAVAAATRLAARVADHLGIPEPES